MLKRYIYLSLTKTLNQLIRHSLTHLNIDGCWLLKLSSHLICHSVPKQRQTEQGFIFTFAVSTADSQMPAVGNISYGQVFIGS
jgi:hypothetical protein